MTETEDEQFEARAQLLLERKVEYLGATTDAQLDAIRATDRRDELLQTVSALPLTEQMVWLYNGGADGAVAPDTHSPRGTRRTARPTRTTRTSSSTQRGSTRTRPRPPRPSSKRSSLPTAPVPSRPMASATAPVRPHRS